MITLNCGGPSWTVGTPGTIVGNLTISDTTQNAVFSFGSFPPAAGVYKAVFCGGASFVFSGTFYGRPYDILTATYNNYGGLTFLPSGAGAFTFWNNDSAYSVGDLVVAPVPIGQQGTIYGSGGYLEWFRCVKAQPPGSSSPNVQSDILGDIYQYSNFQPSFDGGEYWELAAQFGFSTAQGACAELGPSCGSGSMGLAWLTGSHSYATDQPQFLLRFFPLLISMLAPGAGISVDSGVNPNWSVHFRPLNLSTIPWPAVTFELVTGGGAAAMSGPVTASLHANADDVSVSPFAVSADPSQSFITMTFKVSVCGAEAGRLVFPCYPIWTFSASANFPTTNPLVCSGVKYRKIFIASQRLNQNAGWESRYTGDMTVTATDVLSGVPLRVIVGTNCSSASTSLTYPNVQDFGGYIEAQATDRQVRVTVQSRWRYNGTSPALLTPLYSEVVTIPAA